MSKQHPTRREILMGMATMPLFQRILQSQASHSSVCFMSAVEMARLIRAKKLSAREALAAHLKQIERVNPKAFLKKYEYFVLPTTQLPPFDVDTPYPTEIAGVKFSSYIDWMKSCWYVSATGNPAAAVPGGFTPEGLPVGVQIVGRTREDFSVLQMAHAFEQATDFGKKRPAIA